VLPDKKTIFVRTASTISHVAQARHALGIVLIYEHASADGDDADRLVAPLSKRNNYLVRCFIAWCDDFGTIESLDMDPMTSLTYDANAAKS
jgi:hypothetical protein